MCCRTSKVLYGLSCLFWIGHAKGKSSWIARESSNNRSEEDSFHQSNRFVGWYRIRPSEENSKRDIEWTACLSSEPSVQLFFCVFFFCDCVRLCSFSIITALFVYSTFWLCCICQMEELRKNNTPAAEFNNSTSVVKNDGSLVNYDCNSEFSPGNPSPCLSFSHL